MNTGNIETVCVHGGRGLHKEGAGHYGSVAFPIYQSATFAHLGVGKSTGYDYSRTQNPTRENAERAVAALDGVRFGLGFSTGMAAVACLMELFLPGERVLVADDLYGGTIRLFDKISAKNGLIIETFEDEGELARLAQSLTEEGGAKVAAVFIETPTNPMMNVIGISVCARIAKDLGALLIVDNTFLTPVLQRPFEHGADIVLYSGTKYLGGHNDVLAGFLTTDDGEIAERLRAVHKTTGACLAPFDSFLVCRGLKTLALRVNRQNESAQKIALWLQKQGSAEKVYYPGLEDHPGHGVCRAQAAGFGGMLSFTVDSGETARRVLENVRLIQFAESLGGVESLITYPVTQTHADVPIERRTAKGIDERLLRLSVGIEDAGDIIADLEAALG